MRAMLGAALDGVITIDDAGMIIEFNPAAERMFGHTREAAVGRHMVECWIQPPALRACPLEAGFQALLPRLARDRQPENASRWRRCRPTAAGS